jgi:putative pyrroloquinoline-quinone binding quinoprotein
MTVIDLGEVTHDSAGPALPVNYRRIRHGVLAAVVLLGTLALTGSARPAPPTVHQLWTVPLARHDFAQIQDDTVYLSRVVGDTTELTAYDAATGRPRWRGVTGESTENFGVNPAFDVVLVQADLATITERDGNQWWTSSFSRATVALGAADGTERWRTSGELGNIGVDGTGLAMEHDEHAVVTRMRRIRLSDGRQLWDLPVPGVSSWTVVYRADQPSHVVTVTPGGAVRVYGYADGKLATTGRVPWQHRVSDLMSAGPYLAVRSRRDGPITLYRPDDLRVMWSAGPDIDYFTECGPALCVLDGNGVSSRDPATGRELWRRPDMFSVSPGPPGRVLLDTGGDGGVHQVVDAATGRSIGEPAAGTPLWGGLDGTMVFTRPTTDRPVRQLLTRLDLTTGRQTRLGAVELPDEERGCTFSGRYVGCVRDGTLTVLTAG